MKTDDMIISYDLGTGGVKAALYDASGESLASHVEAYDTFYPQQGWHEQRPEDWWKALVASTRKLLDSTNVDPMRVGSCSISGHSLGVVPIDASGSLLREYTPIWSDSRAQKQTEAFFENVDEKRWYETTGNGFPPPHYSVFKIMWYRDQEPDVFSKVRHVLGTKDYMNYLLTGAILTDHSYASGSGVYDLLNWQYDDNLIRAAGLPAELFPRPVPSTEVIGTLTKQAASELGLDPGVQVVAGGVDNSCMALGARNTRDGRVYNALGSSSWIAVCSGRPVIDNGSRPFVFAHVIPGLYTSAYSIFAAGSSLRWIRDSICRDLLLHARETGVDVYDLMLREAENSSLGANGLLFNPSLAGGTGLDPNPRLRGAFAGLDLSHTRADIIRAGLEGIAMGLRVALDALKTKVDLADEMLVVGGGSNSRLWREILSDAYKTSVLKTNIDQDAAALGAAALAAVGTGAWESFERIDELHEEEDRTEPDPVRSAAYESLMPAFAELAKCQARLADLIPTAG